MKALITGSQGFVGTYLREELESHGYQVIGADRHPGKDCILVEMTCAEQVREAVRTVRPDSIIHLAGQSNVAASWKIPQATFENNVIGSINLMEAVRIHAPRAYVVLVGSSDEYGVLREAGEDVREDIPLVPQTPYAVSKKAQEELAQVYVRAYGMSICMTRSFNHGGAGQRPGFLISDFASGIAQVERGTAQSLKVGNLASRRDFTHVRDVVRAYRLLAERGCAGAVYNVGSGKTYSAREILDRLCAMARCEIPIEESPDKMRPNDTPVICCNHQKLTSDTGWEPEYDLMDILRDTLEYYRKQG